MRDLVEQRVEITRLSYLNATQQLADRLTELLAQLSTKPRVVTWSYLCHIVNGPDTCVYLAHVDGQVVGTVTLLVSRQLCGGKAWAEDLVVDSAYRRRGVARQLMRFLIADARQRGVKQLRATSSRPASQQMCLDLGMVRRQSQLFEFNLEREE